LRKNSAEKNIQAKIANYFSQKFLQYLLAEMNKKNTADLNFNPEYFELILEIFFTTFSFTLTNRSQRPFGLEIFWQRVAKSLSQFTPAVARETLYWDIFIKTGSCP